MISDRKMETLKEALKKKHVGTEQEISLLFLEGLKGFFFFFSKLGAKKGKSSAGTPWVTAGSPVLPRGVVFVDI